MAKPKTLPYEALEDEAPYSVTLHNTEGGSDKIYKLAIQRAGDGWVVNFENGRRGSTMAHGTKTKAPGDYAAARKICNGVLFDKVGGGYIPIAGSRFGDEMKAEAIATVAREASGHRPQLVNALETEGDLESCLDDDDYVAQRKYDGERRIIEVVGGVPAGGNRRGQSVALGAVIAEAAAKIGGDLVLDGEQVGDVVYVWDILSLNGVDLRSKPLEDRLLILFDRKLSGAIRMVETAFGSAEKRRMLTEVRDANGEGLVLKKRSAPYAPGRPNSGGDWMKFKFWQSLSAVVGKVNDKRSVGLELVDDAGARIQVGNVTIPANKPVPAVGDVVEVGYLYAYDGGSLFQPTYMGRRTDIDASECLASQRVFKVEEPTEEASAGMRM